MLRRKKAVVKTEPIKQERTVGGQIFLIPEDKILPNPYQPRYNFNESELESLAQSIKINGILQPLTVRACGEEYELIAGERRLRAARIAGIAHIPCIIICADNEHSAVLSLMENIQRKDLNCFEEAESLHKLLEIHNISQEELSKKLGKAPSTISNKLRLLNLPVEIRTILQKEDMTERHARALLRLKTEEQLKTAVQKITENHLNVSETERLVDRMLANKLPPRKLPLKMFRDLRLFTNTLNHAIDTMKRAGIQADSHRSETDDYIEYTVRIPKSESKSSDSA